METVSPESFAVLTVAAALSIGLAASTLIPHIQSENNHQHTAEEHDRSPHVHAMFFVSVNGTNLDFSNESYQLQSRDIHLENGNPYIVHRHAEGITWDRFLETIGLNLTRSGEKLCVELENRTLCDNGTVVLEGQENPDLNTTVMQDQNLVIALGRNHEEEAADLQRRRLPDAYRPTHTRGNRV